MIPPISWKANPFILTFWCFYLLLLFFNHICRCFPWKQQGRLSRGVEYYEVLIPFIKARIHTQKKTTHTQIAVAEN